MVKEQCFAINGEEKVRYLSQLDNSLVTLAKSLGAETNELNTAALRAFGQQNNWDWNRLPRQECTYQNLSQLVERVRQEYKWFDWCINPKDNSLNRGYYDEIRVSSESGLPWVFDFIELRRLKNDGPRMLKKMPSYADCACSLKQLLLEDTVEISEVPGKAREIQKSAMKRSFLEQLGEHEVLGVDTSGFSLEPRAKKIISLGGEELWNVVCMRYSPSSSQFQIYVVDVWQDIREPQITENHGVVSVSPALANSFRFAEDNAAWYIMRCIDENFRSLHPVHVSRGLVGPFENKYCNGKVLPITKELLADDSNAGLLRFSRQFSYAPNHESVGGENRQIIYRDDWRDEAIVCSAGSASRVSKSVLGTNVRVFES